MERARRRGRRVALSISFLFELFCLYSQKKSSRPTEHLSVYPGETTWFHSLPVRFGLFTLQIDINFYQQHNCNY